jgi:hypoxanthine phosphoribosyltransferase
MKDVIKVIITEEEIEERIKFLGEQISRDYAGKQVHMI